MSLYLAVYRCITHLARCVCVCKKVCWVNIRMLASNDTHNVFVMWEFPGNCPNKRLAQFSPSERSLWTGLYVITSVVRLQWPGVGATPKINTRENNRFGKQHDFRCRTFATKYIVSIGLKSCMRLVDSPTRSSIARNATMGFLCANLEITDICYVCESGAKMEYSSGWIVCLWPTAITKTVHTHTHTHLHIL